jgi:hypothetical protein
MKATQERKMGIVHRQHVIRLMFYKPLFNYPTEHPRFGVIF